MKRKQAFGWFLIGTATAAIDWRVFLIALGVGLVLE